MNYFFIGTMMAMCSLHLGSGHNKQEPDGVLGTWMIKDPSTPDTALCYADVHFYSKKFIYSRYKRFYEQD